MIHYDNLSRFYPSVQGASFVVFQTLSPSILSFTASSSANYQAAIFVEKKKSSFKKNSYDCSK